MKEAIIIFTRVPLPGKTKTRLQSMLSGYECAEIHKNFLKDLKNTCEKMGRDIFIFHTPIDKENIISGIFGEKHSYKLQEGRDLGEKMYNAIEYVLKNKYDSCILIGSDIPFLSIDDLQKAFDILKEKDIVLGPTVDKGYYLVGMKKPLKRIFENIEYGHGNVLDNTITSIKRENLTYGLTNTNRDIDAPDDLMHFYHLIIQGKIDLNMNTSKFIKNIVEEQDKECLELTV